MVLSPMPAQTTPGSESDTARAPTDEVLRYPSLTFVQVTPASSVFQMPPATAPNQNTAGSHGSPATATTLPPRGGPMQRNRMASSNESIIRLSPVAACPSCEGFV